MGNKQKTSETPKQLKIIFTELGLSYACQQAFTEQSEANPYFHHLSEIEAPPVEEYLITKENKDFRLQVAYFCQDLEKIKKTFSGKVQTVFVVFGDEEAQIKKEVFGNQEDNDKKIVRLFHDIYDSPVSISHIEQNIKEFQSKIKSFLLNRYGGSHIRPFAPAVESKRD